jgi:hypothetical protein
MPSSSSDSTNEYLLLFRGSEWDKSLSPAELQHTLSAFLGWFEKLSTDGVVKAGQPLLDDARIVSGRNGQIVSDGPFAESKEAVGGYFLVRADSLDDAVKVAQQCPLLGFGTIVEVRPIAAVCPTVQRAQKTLSAALATATN